MRLPCPSLSLEICSDSCPLSRWCHPIISSSAISSFCLQSFPASRSFPKEQIFASGGQSIEVSAAVSALPKNVQGWFPIGLTSWSLCSPRDSLESSSAPHFESINSSALSLLYGPALTSTYDSCKNHQFSSVQLLSRVWATPWTAARQASLSITNS